MWWILPAAAAPEVAAERATRGAIGGRFAGADGAALSLLYAGEHDGEVGPCGCSRAPRGGLPRLAAAVAARREADPTPALLLHTGGWLAGPSEIPELARAALDADLAMHRAVGRFPFDVLHTTWQDLPSVALGPHPGMVSATHRPASLPVIPWKDFERGGETVRVIGVSAAGPPEGRPEGTSVRGPLAALAAVPRPDDALVVVLAFEVPDLVDAIARVDGVDVVIDAAGWDGSWDPRVVGDAVVVRSADAGGALGELRLWVSGGRVSRALARYVSLDAEVPEDPFVGAAADGG